MSYWGRKTNLVSTLEIVMHLIDRDIKIIKAVSLGKEARWNRLDKDNREALLEYAKTINSILSDEDKLRKGAKKKYNKVQTEELLKILQDRQKK